MSDRWERLGDDSRDALVKQLNEYLEDAAPFSVLVFEAEALDQRMRLAKTFAEKTLVVSVELSDKPEERARIAGPLAFEMARELGVKLERDAAEELVEILNGDLAAIHSELEKLATYAGERKSITRADVELMVVSARKYSVWELADMLARARASKALEFLDGAIAGRRATGAGCWALSRGCTGSCSRRRSCLPARRDGRPPAVSACGGRRG